MERYLFDKYVASRFLGVRVTDPMVDKFMQAVAGILNERVAEYLVDYSVVRGYEFDWVFEAYKEFINLYYGIGDGGSLPDRPEVYQILLDSNFYKEMENKINEYYAKMYEKYLPTMSQRDRNELEKYIQMKNQEKVRKANELIARIDKSIEEIDQVQMELDAKIHELNKGVR